MYSSLLRSAGRSSAPLGRALGQRSARAVFSTEGVKSDTQSGHKDVTTKIASKHNENIVWSDALLTKEDREQYLDATHSGATLYLTGLSGSGKSTVGAALECELLKLGVHAYRLDGDNIRFGLNAGLGFSATDREENLRRIAEVGALFNDSGVVAITSFISPYRKSREAARARHAKGELPFLEVYCDVPLSVAESRDPKGLYKKARAGELKNFTGIDDPYEAPENPEIVIKTHQLSVEESCEKIIGELRARKIIRV